MITGSEDKEVTKLLPLKEFLLLTEKETELRELINAAVHNSDWSGVQKAITANSTEESPLNIIKIAEHDKQIENICRSSSLSKYWLQEWLKIQTDGYQMQAQPLINYFDLYRGYYFYLLAVDVFAENHDAMSEQVIEYLSKAQAYDSFHAACQLNGYLLKALKQTQTQDKVNFPAILAPLEKLAKLHLTPGYILLARTHFEWAQFNTRFAGSGSKVTESYGMALRYVYMAEQLEPYSRQSLANACVGGDLVEYFGLEGLGWSGYKAHIIEQAGGRLNSAAVYKEADLLIEQHLKNLVVPSVGNSDEKVTLEKVTLRFS